MSTSTPPAPVLPEEPAAPTAHRGRSVAAWCAAHRWRTLFAALLVLAGGIVLLGPGLTTTEPAEQLVGDSRDAVRLVEGADFGERPTENVVVTPVDGSWAPARAAAVGRDVAAAYSGVEGVSAVGEPVTSADGSTVLVPLVLTARTAADAADVVGPSLDVTARYAAAHRDLRVGQVGPGSIDTEVGQALEADFRRAELVSLPVTLGVLLVAFGSVVAAGVPVLLGAGAVAAALGLTAWTSRSVTPVDQNTQSLVLLVGLAVGVDYALFVLRRAREERAAGASVADSIRTASATAGRAVVVSGVTVVVAMAGMLVAGGLFTSLAIGGMLVVTVAVLASVTVLPALLAVLGDRVERLRIPFLHRPSTPRTEGGWGRLAGVVTRRPLLWAGAATALLLALAAPALGMRTTLPGAESLPKSFATVDAYDRLTTAFPQDGTTVDVVVSAPAAAADRVDTALRQAFPVALATGDVVGTQPQVRRSADGRVHVLALAVPHEESSPATVEAVDAVRADVVPQVRSALAGVDGVAVHVGGAAAATDLSAWMTDRLPWVVGFVLLLTFGVVLVSFGSPALALATVALNALSVGAAYGVMTLVFQGAGPVPQTWAEGLLGFTSIGSVAAWLPLLMFVLLFGLSMDYHVFVVSRVREAFAAGASPREAARLGVARSAGVVTSAAAVMVAVFAIFATLSTLEMKQLGVGLATAVLLDATLVRGVLLPAVLALLGRRAHTGPRWVPALHG